MQKLEQCFLTIVACIAKMLDTMHLFNILRYFKKNSVTILMYHGISSSTNTVLHFDYKHIEKEKFVKQLLYLQKHYRLISLHDFMLWKDGRKTFQKPVLMLTFDDGYKNCYTQLFPLLKKYNIPATIFLPTSYIGTKRPAWYDIPSWCIAQTKKQEITLRGKRLALCNETQKISALVQIKKVLNENNKQRKEIIEEIITQTACNPNLCSDENYLFVSWEECKEMQQNNIAFGSHSATHQHMTILSEKEIKKEIIESKREIEEQLKNHCTAFSYPFGSNNQILRKILAKEGYLYACTSTYGTNAKKTDQLQLKRIGLNNRYDLDIFKLTLFINFPVFHHWILWVYSRIRYYKNNLQR